MNIISSSLSSLEFMKSLKYYFFPTLLLYLTLYCFSISVLNKVSYFLSYQLSSKIFSSTKYSEISSLFFTNSLIVLHHLTIARYNMLSYIPIRNYLSYFVKGVQSCPHSWIDQLVSSSHYSISFLFPLLSHFTLS